MPPKKNTKSRAAAARKAKNSPRKAKSDAPESASKNPSGNVRKSRRNCAKPDEMDSSRVGIPPPERFDASEQGRMENAATQPQRRFDESDAILRGDIEADTLNDSNNQSIVSTDSATKAPEAPPLVPKNKFSGVNAVENQGECADSAEESPPRRGPKRGARKATNGLRKTNSKASKSKPKNPIGTLRRSRRKLTESNGAASSSLVIPQSEQGASDQGNGKNAATKPLRLVTEEPALTLPEDFMDYERDVERAADLFDEEKLFGLLESPAGKTPATTETLVVNVDDRKTPEASPLVSEAVDHGQNDTVAGVKRPDDSSDVSASENKENRVDGVEGVTENTDGVKECSNGVENSAPECVDSNTGHAVETVHETIPTETETLVTNGANLSASIGNIAADQSQLSANYVVLQDTPSENDGHQKITSSASVVQLSPLESSGPITVFKKPIGVVPKKAACSGLFSSIEATPSRPFLDRNSQRPFDRHLFDVNDPATSNPSANQNARKRVWSATMATPSEKATGREIEKQPKIRKTDSKCFRVAPAVTAQTVQQSDEVATLTEESDVQTPNTGECSEVLDGSFPSNAPSQGFRPPTINSAPSAPFPDFGRYGNQAAMNAGGYYPFGIQHLGVPTNPGFGFNPSAFEAGMHYMAQNQQYASYLNDPFLMGGSTNQLQSFPYSPYHNTGVPFTQNRNYQGYHQPGAAQAPAMNWHYGSTSRPTACDGMVQHQQSVPHPAIQNTGTNHQQGVAQAATGNENPSDNPSSSTAAYDDVQHPRTYVNGWPVEY